jgi:hypothetical protein
MGSPCSTRLFISDSFYTFEKAKPITQLSFLHNRWPTATGTGRHDAASWPQKPQPPQTEGGALDPQRVEPSTDSQPSRTKPTPTPKQQLPKRQRFDPQRSRPLPGQCWPKGRCPSYN